MFCPKCGSILVPKKESGKRHLTCMSCGYADKKTTEQIYKENVGGKKKLEVVDDKSEDEKNPVVDAECPKCQNKKAYYWLKQTRAGDESETKFFKCTKCKHTWRSYD